MFIYFFMQSNLTYLISKGNEIFDEPFDMEMVQI
jgi:hypothetical protein